MAKPLLLEDSFSRMVRDKPRNMLPEGACWRIKDFIPDVLGAPLSKRGGVVNENTSVLHASATHVMAVAHAPVTTGGPKLCAIDEDNRLTTISGGTPTTVGTTRSPICKLPTHRGFLLIPDDDGTTVPHTYDGTTLTAMTGSPPAGIFVDVFRDFTVLGRSAANPTRLWFSNASNPNSWDTASRYVDTSFPITGIAAMRSAILIFSQAKTERIRGTTPPPITDMVLEPLFDVGCFDARSITLWKDLCIFANLDGVYMTDGASLMDITQDGMMKDAWRDAISGSTAVTIGTGYYQDFLFISLRTTGGVACTNYMVHLPTARWFEVNSTVFESLAFGQGLFTEEELLFGSRTQPYVFSISSCFAPASANKTDPIFNTAVTPLVETAFYEGTSGLKTFKELYATYDLRDAASDNPIFTLSYIDTPEDTSYTALSPTLTETTVYTRSRIPMGFSSSGCGLKVEQSNASSTSALYRLEAEIIQKEQSRLA